MQNHPGPDRVSQSHEIPWPALSTETHPWSDGWRTYAAAVVPPIAGLDIADVLDADTAAEVGAAQQAIIEFDQQMTDAFGGQELGTIETVLLRSEASSSSQIEHLTVSAKQLALAELDASKSINARLVRANVEAMRATLGEESDFDTATACAMQAELLRETGLHIGLREEQVWIGTSGSTPIGADFIPPHHSRVAENLEDLWAFLRQPSRLPLAHVAAGHAQFETIHPFVDGNGRVGRALVHRNLRRTGLAAHVTVPVSAGLLADTRGYVAGLTAYRAGDPLPIVREFARAARHAASIGRELVAELAQVRQIWNQRVRARRDSAVWPIVDSLIGHPAVTTDLAATRAGVSTEAARAAIATLVEADILKRASVGRRNQVWVAEDVTECYDRIAVLIGRRKEY